MGENLCFGRPYTNSPRFLAAEYVLLMQESYQWDIHADLL